MDINSKNQPAKGNEAIISLAKRNFEVLCYNDESLQEKLNSYNHFTFYKYDRNKDFICCKTCQFKCQQPLLKLNKGKFLPMKGRQKVCLCGKGNHEVFKVKIEEESEKIKIKNNCFISQKYYQFNTVLSDQTNKNYYCYYCFRFCRNNDITVEEIMKENQEFYVNKEKIFCNCTCDEESERNVKIKLNFEVLERFFSYFYLKENTVLTKFGYQLINKASKFKQYSSVLEKIGDNETKTKRDELRVLNDLKILSLLSKFFKNTTLITKSDLFTTSKTNFLEYFEDLIYNETLNITINDHMTILLKYYLLIYKNVYLYNLKSQSFFSLEKSQECLSPLHRSLIKTYFNFNNRDIFEYTIFIFKLSERVNIHLEKNTSVFAVETLELFIEYIKFISFIIEFTIEIETLQNILESVSKCIDTIMGKDFWDDLLSKTEGNKAILQEIKKKKKKLEQILTKILMKIIIIINDEAFLIPERQFIHEDINFEMVKCFFKFVNVLKPTNSKILEVFINTNDFYISNIESIFHYCIEQDNFEIINLVQRYREETNFINPEISKLVSDLHETIQELYASKFTEVYFMKKIRKTIKIPFSKRKKVEEAIDTPNKIKSEIHHLINYLIDGEEKSNEDFQFYIKFVQHGYLHKIFTLILLLKKLPQFSHIADKSHLFRYVRDLFKVMSRFSQFHPFFSNYFLNDSLIDFLITDRLYFEDYELSFIVLNFYIKLFKFCKKNHYKLNVLNFMKKLIFAKNLNKKSYFEKANRDELTLYLKLIKAALNVHINDSLSLLSRYVSFPIEMFLESRIIKNTDNIIEDAKLLNKIMDLILSIHDDSFCEISIRLSQHFYIGPELSEYNFFKFIYDHPNPPLKLTMNNIHLFSKLYFIYPFRVKKINDLNFVEKKIQSPPKINNTFEITEDTILHLLNMINEFPSVFNKNSSEFQSDVHLLVNYFKNTVVFPILGMIYSLLYNKEVFNSKEFALKYSIYTLVVVFLKQLRFFFENIKKINLVEIELNKLFSYKLDEIEELIETLNKDIKDLEEQDFSLAKSKYTLNRLNHYLTSLKFSTKVIDDGYYKNSKIEENFINKYELYKRKSINFTNNSLYKFLSFQENNKILANLFFSSYTDMKHVILQHSNTKGEKSKPIKRNFTYNEEITNFLEQMTFFLKIQPKQIHLMIENKGKHEIKLKEIFHILIKNSIPHLIQLIFIQANVMYSDKNLKSYQSFCQLMDFIGLFVENHQLFQAVVYDIKFSSFASQELQNKNNEDHNEGDNGDNYEDKDLNDENEKKEKENEELNKESTKNDTKEKKEEIKNTEIIVNNKNKDDDKINQINLVTFIIKAINHSLHFYDYFLLNERYFIYFEKNQEEFFHNFIKSCFLFLNRLYKGSLEDIYDELLKKEDFFKEIFSLIDRLDKIKTFKEIIVNFLIFLNSLLNSQSIDIKSKNLLVSGLKLNQISTIIEYLMMNCYISLGFPDNATFNNKKIQLHFKNKNQKLLLNQDFIISYNLFMMINILSTSTLKEKTQEALEILKEINKKHFLDIFDGFKRDNKKQIFKFLSKIIKSVEIVIKQKPDNDKLLRSLSFSKNTILKIRKSWDTESKKNKGTLQKYWFLVPELSLYLIKNDIVDTIEKSEIIGDINNQLLNLIRRIDYLDFMINYIESTTNFNFGIFRFLARINYEDAEYISTFLVFAVNILFVSTVKSENDNIFSPYFGVYTVISSIHLAVLTLICLNWIIFELIKYRIAVRESLQRKERKIVMSELFHDWRLVPLFWNLITGIIATSSKELNFLYSLQLFSIWSLFPTMKIAIFTVYRRYQQFLAIAILIIIIVFFYSFISFYFLNEEFRVSKAGDQCFSLISCFLYIMNNGFRSGGGVGDLLQSHLLSESLFWYRFIYDWIFYFIIVLLMINIVNGIIVDTFSALRLQSNSELEQRTDVCFICDKKRSDFEALGKDFAEHKDISHNVTNYIYFLIKVKQTDEEKKDIDLDITVKDSFFEKKADFFPIKKALDLNKS